MVRIIRLILKNSTYFKQMLRLPRDSTITIHFHNQDSHELSTHVESYLTEIRTVTRLNHIRVKRSPPTDTSVQRSQFSFADYISDHVELIFDLDDDKQTRELVDKHEERLSKQVEKLHDDMGVNDVAMKFHQENNDTVNVEREQHRR